MDKLLFFTPALPCATGQGSAMRASIALEILAETFEVVVIHQDVWGNRPDVLNHASVQKFAADYVRLPAAITPEVAQELLQNLLTRGASYIAAVYVFRLASAALAIQVMGLLGNPNLTAVLDLDDDEYGRAERFVPLREADGDFKSVSQLREELSRLNKLQRILLGRFSVSLLACEEERAALAARHPHGRFLVLPNVVRMPESLPPEHNERGNSLLFLGTLDYLPNADGVKYFCASILPLLMRAGQDVPLRPVSLRIVGPNPPPSVQGLGVLPGVTVVGPVKEVGPEYARARAAIVPLRAASGTRIKILEAFSFGTPVVSTSAGAAGLGVEHETHLLIADTPEEFAAACRRLMCDDELAARLARNALIWLRETHSLDRVRSVLRLLFAPRQN
jgi:glycosyltransferase involved in cell wall biosynthesis